MAIIWLIEQDIHLESSAHANLAGNYPVRIISSITSLRSLIRIEKQFYPDVIVINKDLDWDQCNHLINTIHYKLPNSHIIFLNEKYSQDTSTKKQQVYFAKSTMQTSGLISQMMQLSEKIKMQNTNTVRFKDISYDKKSHTITFHPDGLQEKLPLKEAMLLDFFLEQKTRCITREEIQKSIWNQVRVNSRTIDSHMSRHSQKDSRTGKFRLKVFMVVATYYASLKIIRRLPILMLFFTLWIQMNKNIRP